MSSFKDKIESAWNSIKEKTGINPFLLIGSVIGVIVLVLVFESLEKKITILTGVLFPVYMSMKALETDDLNDDTQWCTYWVVFFTFELVELYLGYLVFGILKIIPYYFLIKLIFLIWLFFPTTMGANFIYEKILSKLFSKYEVNIDKAINETRSTLSANSKK